MTKRGYYWSAAALYVLGVIGLGSLLVAGLVEVWIPLLFLGASLWVAAGLVLAKGLGRSDRTVGETWLQASRVVAAALLVIVGGYLLLAAWLGRPGSDFGR